MFYRFEHRVFPDAAWAAQYDSVVNLLFRTLHPVREKRDNVTGFLRIKLMQMLDPRGRTTRVAWAEGRRPIGVHRHVRVEVVEPEAGFPIDFRVSGRLCRLRAAQRLGELDQGFELLLRAALVDPVADVALWWQAFEARDAAGDRREACRSDSDIIADIVVVAENDDVAAGQVGGEFLAPFAGTARIRSGDETPFGEAIDSFSPSQM